MTGRTSAGSGPPVDEAELLDDPVGYYPGFDRFGRLALQIWADGALDTQWISSGLGGAYYPTKPEIVALEYGYDLNGNRTSAYDLRQGNEWPMNHRYSYDGLNRLTMAERNARSEFVFSAPTEAPEKGSQAWLLDPLGNWLELETWSSSSTSATETRTHNKVNELLDRDIPGTSADHTLAYDNAGNLYTDAVSGGSTTTYTHDLWNRLVKVTVGSTVKLEQQFNGLTWRTLKREDTGGSAGLDEERTFTYNANWQLIEERVDANYISSPSLDKRVQYFWGLRYIDDCIMHRADFNNDGDYVDTRENSWYHLTDGMFSSVAILDRAATLVERVSYDSYGQARHHRPGDVNGDGSSGTTDYNIVNAIISGGAVSIGNSSYRAECDLNRDGTINTTDRSLAGTTASAIAAGLISHPDSGGPDNSIGWDGYVFNPVTGDYIVRFRIYRPVLGRWAEREFAFTLVRHGLLTTALDRRNASEQMKHDFAPSHTMASGIGVADRFGNGLGNSDSRVLPHGGIESRPRQYTDGLSLYQYVQGAPGLRTDPTGEGVPAALAILAGVVVACAAPQYAIAMRDYGDATDKFRHCWVSCRMSKTCGAGVTQLAGLGKEALDCLKRIMGDMAGGTGDWIDSLEDLIANQQCIGWESKFSPLGGWLGAIFRDSCEDCCRRRVGYFGTPGE